MKTEHKTLTILFLIIILASLFRLVNLPSIPPGLYPDEAMNGNNALEAISTNNYKVFYPENNGREGLFINIQALFLKFFLNFYPSPEPWMLRFTSALFGILTVIGIYFITKELFRKNERAKTFALVSTFFIATSFWHINFSRIGFRAIMAPCFLVWGTYLLLFAFRKFEGGKNDHNKNPKLQTTNNKQIQITNDQNSKFGHFGFIWKLLFENWILPILAGLVYGLGMHSYIAYRATPALILFIFFLLTSEYGWEKILKLGTLFTLGAIIVSLPLIIYFAQNPQDFLGRTSQISIFSGGSPLKDLGLNIIKTIGMFFVYGDSNWRHNLSGAPELFLPIAIFLVIGIVVGIKKIFKKKGEEEKSRWFKNSVFGFWILFAWLAVATLPVVVSNEGIPHALRSILMIPPAMILAGIGSVFVYDWIQKKNIPRVVFSLCIILFLGLIGIYTFYTYFIIWGQNKETANAFSSDSIEIGNMLNLLPNEIKKYIVVEGDGISVRGIPMNSQTVMYITDSFTPEKQKEKNIVYITPEKKNIVSQGNLIVELK